MVDPGMDALLLAGIEAEGVEMRDTDSVWQLVAEFREQLQGAVLYDLGTDSINVTTSLCGPMQAVAVDTSLLAIAQLPADPQNAPDSCALINVHALSFKEIGGPMEAVKQTVDLLPRKTRVVTAEEFIVLLRESFGTPVFRD